MKEKGYLVKPATYMKEAATVLLITKQIQDF